MARILAVSNQKGGVGKTTTAFNLGAVLVQHGCRVLLVDLDPQASLTAFLGLDPYRVERSSFSLLMYEDISLARTLRTQASGMAVVPGSIDLATAAIQMVQTHQPLGRLRTALRDSHITFDYVLIDTPPGLNVLTVAGLMAADEVVIPAQCNSLAMQGIRAIQDTIRRIQESLGNPALKLRGVLATFFDSEAAHSQKTLNEMRSLMPGQVFQTVIPYDVHIADAPQAGKPVVDYAPESPGGKAYRQLADEILNISSSPA